MMKYDFLSHSAILRNVSITITVNWANEVCHLEISKPSAIKRFFREPQIKYSLGTLIFLKSSLCLILFRENMKDYQMHETKTKILYQSAKCLTAPRI